jgi:hypothetical protein
MQAVAVVQLGAAAAGADGGALPLANSPNQPENSSTPRHKNVAGAQCDSARCRFPLFTHLPTSLQNPPLSPAHLPAHPPSFLSAQLPCATLPPAHLPSRLPTSLSSAHLPAQPPTCLPSRLGSMFARVKYKGTDGNTSLHTTLQPAGTTRRPTSTEATASWARRSPWALAWPLPSSTRASPTWPSLCTVSVFGAVCLLFYILLLLSLCLCLNVCSKRCTHVLPAWATDVCRTQTARLTHAALTALGAVLLLLAVV